jgi:hypothetical protein
MSRLLPDARSRSIGKGKIVSCYLLLMCLRGEGREIGRRRGFSARSKEDALPSIGRNWTCRFGTVSRDDDIRQRGRPFKPVAGVDQAGADAFVERSLAAGINFFDSCEVMR